MQAASLLDGLSFDGFPPFKYSRSSAEVDVSRRQVVQALVVSTVVVVLDELVDAVFELTWQIVVLQQDPVFHRAVISLDLTLRHRVADHCSLEIVFLIQSCSEATLANTSRLEHLEFPLRGALSMPQTTI